MNLPLQQWYSGWLTEHESTNLIYAKGDKDGPSLHQVHFIRDTVSSLMWRDKKYDDLPKVTFYDPRYYDGQDREVKDLVRVIGEHRSKSVRLPVFRIHRPDYGLDVVMRYNFHDWNVSVRSERPVEVNLTGYGAAFSDGDRKRYPNGYEKGGYWGYLFFQGFPHEYYFGPHAENPREFSLCAYDDYELYSFVRELSLWMVRG